MRTLMCIAVVLFIDATQGFAQQPCTLRFSYVGEVTFKEWKVGSVIVPTASYLMGRTQADDLKSSHGANISAGAFKVDLVTQDVVFCDDLDKVIQDVIKSKRKVFPITFVEQKTDHAGKYRQVTIEVPVEKIQFVAVGEPRQMIITLPSFRE